MRFFKKRNENVPEIKTKEQNKLLKEAIKSGKAKRVYKVLIRDLLYGIKEDYWELSEEQVSKHVNSDGIAHINCYYEDGKPQYMFVNEKLWKNWDKVEVILKKNPTISIEELADKMEQLSG